MKSHVWVGRQHVNTFKVDLHLATMQEALFESRKKLRSATRLLSIEDKRDLAIRLQKPFPNQAKYTSLYREVFQRSWNQDQ